ncbi:MAG: prolipoprotein diacylglyceryl transferase [Treponema sp.]|nr:prolipoprotein diacylglyceryl transferase [Treponema sp.]
MAIDFPSWLRPEIIPGLPFRWYGLMYIFAFATAFLLYRRQLKERRFPMTEDQLYSLFTWGILGLLLGARIFSALVYDTTNFYLMHPWLIFWPFRDGAFVGLQGMSYHGGALGGLLAVVLYARVKRFNFREIGDMYAAAIPLGFTFGRLGNFINGELYGRVTTGPLGMIFPNARPIPATEAWVLEAAEQTGAFVFDGMANLPRHPSQLYQMILEGIVLWAIIWFFRNRKPFNGFLVGLYFMGYGVFRFFVEYFREPDAALGFILEFGRTGLPAYVRPILSFSTGQILSFLMIVFGVIWMIVASRMPGHEPVRVYPEGGPSLEWREGKNRTTKTAEEKANERNRRRKRRKKLR